MDSQLVEGLNPEQCEAVTYEGSALLIIAGAGSGKTRVLTHRVAHLLAGGRAKPHEILAITFTNKAAGEMRGRVEALVGPEARSMWVSTFHAACVRVLRREHDAVGLTSAFSIYDAADSVNLMRLVSKEMDLDPKQYPPKALAARIGRFKDELLTPEEAVRLTEGVSRFTLEYVAGQAYGPYQARLEAANAVDFDDIIAKVVRLLQGHPDVARRYRERFRHILVDEYQDTNHAQYVLIRELAGAGAASKDQDPAPANLTVVGDADQSIYAFRGASIRNILEFEKDFPDAHVIRLEQNYRSTQTILDAANAVIAHNSERRPKNLWTDAGAGEPIFGYAADSEQDEARFIAEEILRLMKEDGVAPSEVAVMYRTNSQSRAIEERFIRAEIPYTIVGGTRFYERAEVKDMLAYLAAVANEDDDVAVRRIVNTPRRGIGEATVEAIEAGARKAGVSFGAALRLDDIPLSARARTAVGGLVTLLDDLRALARDNGVAAVIDAIADRTGYLDVLRKSEDPQDASRIENVMELVAVGREFGDENPEGTLHEFLEKVALVADADLVPDAVGGGGVVTLMTLHTAKGLEYPVVFVTGLEEGTFPHLRSMETPGELEEERRLAYVGLTRAKERLYLTRAEVRSSWGSPQYFAASRFAEEIPGELVTWRRSEGLGEIERLRAERAERAGAWSGLYSGDRGEGSPLRREPPSPPGAKPGPDLGLEVGDRVSHDQYGLGRVVALEGGGRNAVAKVDFGDPGVKRLLLRFAPLVKL